MSARYWGEEREPDCIFAVYLRKVKYHSPSLTGVSHYRHCDPENSGGPDLIAHLQWETVKERVVKAGTVQRLFDCLLTPEGELDSKHVTVFLNTFRAFTSVAELLNLWRVKYETCLLKEPKSAHKDMKLNSLRSVLMCWLELFPDDFRESPDYTCLARLLDFTSKHLPHLKDVHAKVTKLWENFCRDDKPNASKRYSLQKMSLVIPAEGLDFAGSTAPRLVDFAHIEARYVAEQLTYWDAELFKRLIPYQCLGCMWARRNKSSAQDSVYSVKATVDQFNAISKRVMSSVLQPGHKSAVRAKIILKWIEVAKELRLLKNYSSLKAVLSGLSSEPVHRLKYTWSLVPKDYLEEFEELSRIFSEDQNFAGFRDLLDKEGTAKSVTVEESPKNVRQARKLYRHRRAKSDMGEIQGAVPYLGTFLTDLTYIDTAHPDLTEDGLINFEKRRKEFEILAKIKLFQSAANNYHITADQKFRAWFAKLPTFDEQECYNQSLKVEAQILTSTPDIDKVKKRQHRKSSLFGSLNSSYAKFFVDFPQSNRNSDSSLSPPSSPNHKAGSLPKSLTTPNGFCTSPFSQFYVPTPEPYSPTSRNAPSVYATNYPRHNKSYNYAMFNANVHQRSYSEFDPKLLQRWSPPRTQQRSDSGYISRDFTAELTNGHHPEKQMRKSDSYVSLVSEVSSVAHSKSVISIGTLAEQQDPDCHIVRVRVDNSLRPDEKGQAVYKCIKLENHDKTHTLIAKVIDKHRLNGAPQDYVLVQTLPNGDELVLPERVNAFYAVHVDENKVVELVLRRKIDQPPVQTLRMVKKKRNLKSNILRWSSSGVL